MHSKKSDFSLLWLGLVRSMQKKGADEEKERKNMKSREERNLTGGKEVEDREHWP